MKRLALALIVLSAFAAACHERKQDQPAPDYNGVRARSEQSHGSLDSQSTGSQE